MKKEIINQYGAKIGDPVTISIGTDRYPAVVVKVTKTTMTVKEVETGKNKKQWPEQDFEVFLDKPKGKEEVYRKNKFGSWVNGSFRARVGQATYYQDPSF